MNLVLTLNTAPLTHEPSPAEAQALRQRRKAGEFGPNSSVLVGCVTIIVLVGFVAVGVGGFVALSTMRRVSTTTPGGEDLPPGFGDEGYGDAVPPAPSVFDLVASGFQWIWAIAFLLMAAFIAWAIRRAYTKRGTWMRMVQFADANNLRYTMYSHDPLYPGLLFGRGGNATNHVWSPSGLLADAGGYEYETGTGDEKTTHSWNFVAFRLPRPMPHILLDSVGNGLGNLPAAFSSSQIVKLGEPFDSRFRLYAPSDYAGDAFRIFPPNLMERLMGLPEGFDIEIVDSWLFLYTQRDMDLSRPDVWELIESIANVTIGRLGDVAQHYRDDRVDPRTPAVPLGSPGVAAVAPQGRRLQGGGCAPLVVAIIAFAVIALLFVGMLGSALFLR